MFSVKPGHVPISGGAAPNGRMLSLLLPCSFGIGNYNTQARQPLYEHARTILVAQLRSQDLDTALSILVERVALEGAILRAETVSPSMCNTKGRRVCVAAPCTPP
jgi:hypothetical protein